jgi:hypothetical protein
MKPRIRVTRDGAMTLASLVVEALVVLSEATAELTAAAATVEEAAAVEETAAVVVIVFELGF